MYANIRFLLSFSGRLNRLVYWKVFLILTIVLMALEWPPIPRGLLSSVWIISTFALLGLALPVYLSIAVRRLHDRNRSGWWLVVFLLIPILLDELVAMGSNHRILTERPLSDLLAIPKLSGWVLAVWGAVELKLLKGTEGPNRFGDDPLRTDLPQAAC